MKGRSVAGRGVYVVYSGTAVTAPIFKPRGYASQGGRMDVIASSILAAQHDPNPGFYAALLGPPDPPKILRVDRWGFRSEYHVVAEVLAGFKNGGMISISRGDPLDPVYQCRECTVFLVEEGGNDVSVYRDKLCGDTVYLLGGHTGFPQSLYSVLEGVSDATISLGSISLQTYQAILYLAWARSVNCGPSSRRE
ncbi:MAG: hypothetical protein GSR86_02810 [Desulfurococcales archaeon]|nr:hypothetical protein [Desulfurococcales archaeon]